jgi:hypothetical protein
LFIYLAIVFVLNHNIFSYQVILKGLKFLVDML